MYWNRENPHHQVYMIGKENIGMILLPGNHQIVGGTQHTCSLFPLSGRTEIFSSGLQWDLGNSYFLERFNSFTRFLF